MFELHVRSESVSHDQNEIPRIRMVSLSKRQAACIIQNSTQVRPLQICTAIRRRRMQPHYFALANRANVLHESRGVHASMHSVPSLSMRSLKVQQVARLLTYSAAAQSTRAGVRARSRAAIDVVKIALTLAAAFP